MDKVVYRDDEDEAAYEVTAENRVRFAAPAPIEVRISNEEVHQMTATGWDSDEAGVLHIFAGLGAGRAEYLNYQKGEWLTCGGFYTTEDPQSG